jgi:hypothetical protein
MRMATSTGHREKIFRADRVDRYCRERDGPRGRGGVTIRITSSQRSDITAADHLRSGHHSLPRPVSRHPARLRSGDAAATFKLPAAHKIFEQKQVSRRAGQVMNGVPERLHRSTSGWWARRPRPRHLCVSLEQTKAAQLGVCAARYQSYFDSGTSSNPKQFLILRSLY